MSNRTKSRAAIATVPAVISVGGVIATAGATSVLRKRRGRLIVASFALTVGVMMLPAGPAAASSGYATAPQVVSGETPLPRAGDPPKDGWCGSTAPYQDWEQDNSLAVDPTDGSNLAVAWQQDYADAIVVGYTTDGGKSWTKARPPTNSCNSGFPPGLYNSALDPWLAFGPHHEPRKAPILYLSSTAAGSDPVTHIPDRHAAVVNRSRDKGRTWDPPVVLDRTALPGYIDGSYVIADPVNPGRAYATWAKGDAIPTATRNQYVSRTDDGGAHWQPPVPIHLSEPNRVQTFGKLLVLSDGTLLNVFGEVSAHYQPEIPPGPTKLMATRSTDLGITWSAPTTIVTVADPNLWLISSAALAPDGTVYVSWQCAPASHEACGSDPELGESSFSVMYSKSTCDLLQPSCWDNGETWQKGVVAAVKGPPVPAAPSLAVAADGTVGVTFYDHRNDDQDSKPFPKVTDLWFRHSHDEGRSWEEDHLAGPFDQTQAPTEDGALPGEGPGTLADYNGIAPSGNGFATSFSLAKPFAAANFAIADPPNRNCGKKRSQPCLNTDIFFGRLEPALADVSLTK